MCSETSVKETIISSFCLQSSPLWIVIATIAFGMGLDSPFVRQVIHWGPLKTMCRRWAVVVVMESWHILCSYLRSGSSSIDFTPKISIHAPMICATLTTSRKSSHALGSDFGFAGRFVQLRTCFSCNASVAPVILAKSRP